MSTWGEGELSPLHENQLPELSSSLRKTLGKLLSVVILSPLTLLQTLLLHYSLWFDKVRQMLSNNEGGPTALFLLHYPCFSPDFSNPSLPPSQSHQLDRLNDLRETYFQLMTAKLRSKGSDGTMATASPSNRELQFIERNLEEITRVHKKVLYMCLYTYSIAQLVEPSLEHRVLCLALYE